MRTRTKLAAFLWEYRSASLLLLFAFLGETFFLLERELTPKYWMSSALDAYIPFVPIFVVPYLLCFPFLGLGLWALLRWDREQFVPTVLLLCAGFAVANLMFFLFPNGQLLRPANTGNGPFAWLVANLIYANDTNTNCCPSLHVMHQIAVCSGLLHSRLFRDRPAARRGLVFFSISVCAATVFLKQHSILDVFTALLLEYPLYRFFFPQHQSDCRESRALTEY